MLKYVEGDATYPNGDGNKFIIHICNDISAWGSGFVVAISKRWSSPKIQYMASEMKLGKISYLWVEEDICVINMVAQRGIMSFRRDDIPLRYDALEECLRRVRSMANLRDASIHAPRIGVGRAGGDWDTIEEMLLKCLEGIDITIYDLPGNGDEYAWKG